MVNIPAGVGGDGRQGDAGSYNPLSSLSLTMKSLPQSKTCTGPFITTLTVVMVTVLVSEVVRVTAAPSESSVPHMDSPVSDRWSLQSCCLQGWTREHLRV